MNYLRDLPLFMIRMYLVYPMFIGGVQKLAAIDGTAFSFEIMGIPYPIISAYLSGLGEAGGALALATGILVRTVSYPMMGIMLVAAYYAHLDNGWSVHANGVEICITYAIMMSVLAVHGGGRILNCTNLVIAGYKNLATRAINLIK